jgi:hypothetical protein
MTHTQLKEWDNHLSVATDLAKQLADPQYQCLRGKESCLDRQRTEGLRKMQLKRDGEREMINFSPHSLCLHCTVVWHALLLRDAIHERLRIEKKYVNGTTPA